MAILEICSRSFTRSFHHFVFVLDHFAHKHMLRARTLTLTPTLLFTLTTGLYGAGNQHGAIPSCANKYTMTDLARTTWGFNGYITSDCGAADGVGGAHQYSSGDYETLRATIGAGMDVDCGGATTEWSPQVMYKCVSARVPFPTFCLVLLCHLISTPQHMSLC